MNSNLSVVLAVALAACTHPASSPVETVAAGPATPAEASAFVAQVDKDLRKVWVAEGLTAWDHQTNLTDENEAIASAASEATMAYLSTAIPAAARFDGVQGLAPDVARQLELLKRATVLPAPADAERRAELANVTTRLSSLYGKGEVCDDAGKCRDLGDLEEVLATSRDWDAQLEAWEAWRTVSPPMKPLYERFVELGNEGTREIGFADMGDLWRGGYDMPPQDFEVEVDRLWAQLKPLYEQLHCHVRAKLNEEYGDTRVPPHGRIPAHITGNMWAQSWENLYPLVEPYRGQPSIDVTATLQEKPYTPVEMVKAGESFFTSLGLDPLPETFWERSMFEQPEDRKVVCHASAWDPGLNNDLRIKMCIRPTMDDYTTIHHELGHDYYYHYYYMLPVLYQQGANDGFHEAIGDAIALSITPSHLQKVGLLQSASTSDEAVINQQMQLALAKIAFLPFGRMIDQWRWEVFSGRVKPEDYNTRWWELRAEYQGVGAPGPRPADAFDPGAKYHIPANTPYTRYFLAAVLQFQFHKSLCEAAGQEGLLHECSIYGSKEAGERLQATLALGASKPWPDALEAITGARQMDAQPMVDYFEPLMAWLKEQNRDRQCGWE